MRNNVIKLFISIVAAVVIGIRIYKPSISLDTTNLMLLALLLLPWLSPVIKGFEGFGIKVEFQDAEPVRDTKNAREEADVGLAADLRSARAGVPPDLYFSRLIKLTPVEMVVAFILTNAMVSLTGLHVLAWANFAVLMMLTPLYLWLAGGVNRPGQLIASTVVFAAWMFALGGPFTAFPWYTPLLGALVLAGVTLTAPVFYSPR